MFGHYHDQDERGDIEKDQTDYIVSLMKAKQKPLHVLVEQELTYVYENNSCSMLHRLPLLIEQSKMADVTCTNIEIRDVATAACFVLRSKWPEFIGGHLQDSLSSKSCNLSEITCDDIYESFERSEQYVVQRLNELDISPNLYTYHTRLARIFLDAVLEDIDFKKGEKKKLSPCLKVMISSVVKRLLTILYMLLLHYLIYILCVVCKRSHKRIAILLCL